MPRLTPRTFYRALHKVADAKTGAVERTIVRTVGDSLTQADDFLLRGAIYAGSASAVIDALRLDQLSRTLRERLAKLIRTVFIQAGVVTSSLSPARLNLRFDLTNPRALRYAEMRSAELVREVTAATRRSIRRLVAQGFREGVTVQETARQIREVVGLTTRQARAVEHYRDTLTEQGAENIEARTERYARKLLNLRARTIARTETIAASTNGQQELWQQAAEQGLIDPEATRQTWIVTPDDRLCPICAAIPDLNPDGVALGEMFETPTGPVDGPPVHPNCLPGDSLILPGGRITAQSKRRFDGDMLVVRMASGNHLACTPNHPILTASGWVPARMVNVVGHVIRHRLTQWRIAGDMDHEDVPPSIEQIAKAWRRSLQVSSSPVPIAPEDFHGDGRGAEVAVIRTNGLLRDNLDRSDSQQVRKATFIGRDMELFAFYRLCAQAFLLEAVLTTARTKMGVARLLSSLCRRHAGPFQKFALVLIARRYAALAQSVLDYTTRYGKAQGELIDGLAGVVAGDHGVHVNSYADWFDTWLSRNHVGESMLPQSRADRTKWDAKLARDLHAGLAGPVFRDNVIGIDSIAWHGFVYNVETERHFYLANGVITHNCRCALALEFGAVAEQAA